MLKDVDPHLLFPLLFILVLIFWWALHKLVDQILDKLERKHADRHRK